MFGAQAPPEDDDVTYVGAWLDDHGRDELYERDRLEPFIRCVLSWVSQEAEWRRHPRPLFEGTSFASKLWGPRFDRLHVEGLFVETPRALAARLLVALQTSLSIRGILAVERIDSPHFFAHSLATVGWLVGDVHVHLDHFEGTSSPGEGGLRVAIPRADEAGALSGMSRPDAEATLASIVARGVVDPKHVAVQRGSSRAPVETLVVRTERDAWSDKAVLFGKLALFDLDQAPSDFEERLLETVSRRLVQKAYRNQLVLWCWTGAAAHHPRVLHVALTTGGPARNVSLGALLKGIEPAFFEYGEGELRGEARPLLRWHPDRGLTRFWAAAPPPDTTLTAGKKTVSLRHRIPGVVKRAAGSPLDVHVESLTLQNVRNHARFEHRLSRRFQVIIGDNACGKTTLLDALAAVLRGIVNPRDQADFLREDDVTERIFFQEAFSAERQYPARISAILGLEGREKSQEVLSRDEHAAIREGALAAFMDRLVERVRHGIPVDLPLCAYYGVSRAHQPTARSSLEITAPGSRLEGYAGALDGRLDPLPFQRWFKTMELTALQERRPIVLLEAVREAVRLCIEECETLQHVVARDELMLRFRGGRMVPFRQLSDGYRLTLAMVADLAWRCVTLNPHLGPAAPEETSGVVLIDELDLHLHPRWQRHIVGDLGRAFPRLQFIATTHSPFIVQSMRAEEVLNLDAPGQEMSYQTSSIEDIAEDAMGIEGVQRSRRFQDMERAAGEYYRLLEEKPVADEEAVQLKAELDALMLPFADNPAYVAFLRANRAAKGLL